MKSIISFLAITTLSLTAVAFAQEESPSPTEEKPSATVEETPAPASEQTPVVAPAPEKASTPMAEKSAAPAETKKATAAAKSESSAANAPAAAKSSKKMSPEASVRDMENRWESAVMTHDASAIPSFIAPEFMGVYKNKFSTKSSVISQFKSDKDTYKSAKNERLNVKMYGPNLIVVTGRTREKGTSKDGKAFDHSYLFTDTLMGRGGQWQCVASQVAQIK